MDPVTRHENVILTLKLNKFLASDDGVEEVILSSYNNSVNEIEAGRVVARYRFPKPISVVQRLKVYYSYEPKFKHYTVMNGSDLIILRKAKSSLTLHKTYANVVHYEITDHWNIGRPQIVIHVTDLANVIVTDCHVENNFDPVKTKSVPAFAPLIQKSKLRIAAAEKSLANRHQLLSKVSRALVFNSENDHVLSTVDKLVCLKEGLTEGDAGLLVRKSAISVGEPWFKMFSSFWIIAFPVVNISTTDIASFEMYVSHSCVTIEKTVLFETSPIVRGIYRESNALLPNQQGILIGVVKEPTLISDFYTLECLCSYESTSISSGHSYLGKLDISAADLTGDKYRPFIPELSTTDVISIRAAFKSEEVHFHLIEINEADFIEILRSNLNLKQIDSSSLINVEPFSLFYELLITINNSRGVLTVHYHSVNNCLRLIHKMVSVMRGKALFKLPEDNLTPALDALRKEISFIKSLMIREMMQDSEEDPSSVSGNLIDVSRELMFLEIQSAAAVNTLNDK